MRQCFLALVVLLQSLSGLADHLPQIDLLPCFPPSRLRKLPYCENTTIDAYRRIGSRDPRWDSHAELGLSIYARFVCADQVVSGTTNFSAMVRELKAAIDAGCDDPLVRYAAVRLKQRNINIDSRPPAKIYGDIVDGLKVHQYPAIRQALMYLRAAESISLDRGDRTRIENLLKASGRKLTESLKEKADREDIYTTAEELFDTCQKAMGDRKLIFDFLQTELRNSSTIKSEAASVVSATFFIQWGWDARGRDTADKVTPEGWRLFNERLGKAEELLRAAWNEDPSDAFACAQMITALAGRGRPRAEWEQWFQRGKKANPSLYRLYTIKLNFLEPKWDGSKQEAIRFGRECAKEANWKESVPFILVDAYDRFRTGPYYEDPNAWAEIRPVYEEYLNLYPENNCARSAYCHRAVRAKDWKLAQRLLVQLGDLVVPHAFQGGYDFDVLQIKQHSNREGSFQP